MAAIVIPNLLVRNLLLREVRFKTSQLVSSLAKDPNSTLSDFSTLPTCYAIPGMLEKDTSLEW